MNTIDVDEARRLCGFNSLTGNCVVSEAFRAIRKSADKDKKTGTSVKFLKFKLQKYTIEEARLILEDKGFIVDVSKDNSSITLNISWFIPADKDRKLVL